MAVAGLAAVVVLALIYFFFYLVSQGALAEGVAAIDRGEERRFGLSFRSGLSNFWRVLGQILLLFLIALALALAVGLPAALVIGALIILPEAPGAGVIIVSVLVGLLAFLLFIVGVVALYIVSEFALRALVVGGEGVTGAIGSGYRLFRENLGRSLLIWLLSIALSVGIGLAIAIVMLVVGLLLFLPTILLAAADFTVVPVITGAFAGLAVLAILLVVSGAFGTFRHTYWTLAYLRMNEPGPTTAAAPEAAGPAREI